MKRIAELLLAPIIVGVLLLMLTGPVARWTAPSDRASVTTTDTGVRLSAETLREVANDAAPLLKNGTAQSGSPAVAKSSPSERASAKPASPASTPTTGPSPTSSPTPDPVATTDRLAVYLVDVYNDGSTEIGGKRFNLSLAPQFSGQGDGRIYRVGNAAGTRLFDRMEGLHFRPSRISAWIGVPSLKPGQRYTGWVIGEADRTLLAATSVGGLPIQHREIDRDGLFAPADNLRAAFSANIMVLAISFVIALGLGFLLWLVAATLRKRQPLTSVAASPDMVTAAV